MRKYIKNNWIVLVLGIMNLCVSFLPMNKVIILNAFVAGMCLSTFTLGCINAYYEEKYGKD